jgi:hypothetical protein
VVGSVTINTWSGVNSLEKRPLGISLALALKAAAAEQMMKHLNEKDQLKNKNYGTIVHCRWKDPWTKSLFKTLNTLYPEGVQKTLNCRNGFNSLYEHCKIHPWMYKNNKTTSTVLHVIKIPLTYI